VWLMVKHVSTHGTQCVIDSVGQVGTGVVHCDDTCHVHARMHSADSDVKYHSSAVCCCCEVLEY
jgi:hypothetical protein